MVFLAWHRAADPLSRNVWAPLMICGAQTIDMLEGDVCNSGNLELHCPRRVFPVCEVRGGWKWSGRTKQ
jgi:hypothetical protein